jgi:hypothetical protein
MSARPSSRRAWIALVRTLQPVAGARANARDAVLRDRRRAEQRRQAMLAAALAPGQQIGLDLGATERG